MITLFTVSHCSLCAVAKKMLTAKGIEFIHRPIDFPDGEISPEEEVQIAENLAEFACLTVFVDEHQDGNLGPKQMPILVAGNKMYTGQDAISKIQTMYFRFRDLQDL